MSALCINLGSTVRGYHPLDKMLDNTLIKLMKNVGSDGSVDMGEWEIFPEGFNDRLDADVFACLKEMDWVIIETIECIENCFQIFEFI